MQASWAPAWQQPLEHLLDGHVTEPPSVDMDDWDEDDPASFYLPSSLAGNSDSPF